MAFLTDNRVEQLVQWRVTLKPAAWQESHPCHLGKHSITEGIPIEVFFSEIAMTEIYKST